MLDTASAIWWNGWNSPGWTTVNLPHDFSIGQQRDPATLAGPGNGYFPGGVGAYEKVLPVLGEWSGRTVVLEFEGVYGYTTVWVNRHMVAQHPYGYSGFHCDLTPYLVAGTENTIRVLVNNSALPNSRWYSGSGIYRHAWLLVGDSVHVVPEGIQISTPTASRDASTVTVQTTLANRSMATARVALQTTVLADGVEVASIETVLEAIAGTTAEVGQILVVSPTELWSPEHPYLYTVRSEVMREHVLIDSVETRLGIRDIRFDAQHGFRLNGEAVKLRGGCVHHDCGLLGAASYDRAEARKIELLKACGFNAVRCAHNPPAPAFLDACDRQGLLVIDEAFDCWREGKTANDYSVHFAEWWQRDLAAMVLRDRNHPCVVLWSIGNEIGERDGRSDGYGYARKLADFVRQLDKTRAVTSALCELSAELASPAVFPAGAVEDEAADPWGSRTSRFAAPLDVVGYNYLQQRYEQDGNRFPGRIICGTESFPKDAFDCWNLVERLPFVIGDFVWTGLDYLGEAGIGIVRYDGQKRWLGEYPWHQAFCGDIDICGFRRPQSYYRDCVWGRASAPYIAVHNPEHYGRIADPSRWSWPDVRSSWTWPGFDNRPIVIDLYCPTGDVELFVNGTSLGRKPAGKANRYIATYETVYVQGELEAVGYDGDTECARTVLRTVGEPASVRLTPDRRELEAASGDLSYVTVELLDAAGDVVPHQAPAVRVVVYGVGALVAVGSSNPISEEPYTGDQRRFSDGRAMAVVRTTGEPGDITVAAYVDGLPVAETHLVAK